MEHTKQAAGWQTALSHRALPITAMLSALYPPITTNPLELMFLLDDAGMEHVVFSILKSLDKSRWQAVKGTCKRARDIARRSATSAQNILDSYTGDLLQSSCEDWAVTHPNITQLHLTSMEHTNLHRMVSCWPDFLRRLPKLNLTIELLWEATELPELHGFLCSLKSLKDLNFTLSFLPSFPLPQMFPSSFTVQLSSETNPLTDLGDLLHAPLSQAIDVHAATAQLPVALLSTPLFRHNLAKVTLHMSSDGLYLFHQSMLPMQSMHPRCLGNSTLESHAVWDAVRIAAATSTKPLAVELLGRFTTVSRPDTLKSFSEDAARLVGVSKNLSSLTVDVQGRYDCMALLAITQAASQHSELQDLTWHGCSAATLPQGTFPHLTSLNLPGFSPPNELAASVSCFTSLQRLELEVWGVGAQFTQSLTHLSSLVHLRILSMELKPLFAPFEDSSSRGSADTISKVTLVSLETLHIGLKLKKTRGLLIREFNSITYPAVELFLGSLTAPKLTTVTGRNLPARAFGELTTRHPQLELPCPHNFTGNTGCFKWKTYRQKALILVVLDGRELREIALNFPHIVPFIKDPLGAVAAKDVKAMAGAGGERLLHIMLNSIVSCTGDVLEYIAATCPNLQTLDLHMAPSNTAGLVAVAEKLHNLRILRLRGGVRIDDASMRKLASSCPNLQCLCLGCTSEMSEDALLSLTQLQRDCKVLTVIAQRRKEGVLERLSKDGWGRLLRAGWTVMLSSPEREESESEREETDEEEDDDEPLDEWEDGEGWEDGEFDEDVENEHGE